MSLEIFDRAQALKNIGGDEGFFTEIIAIFREDSQRLMNEALSAVAENRAVGLQYSAHALKGTIGFLAAKRAFQQAILLEKLGAEERMEEAKTAVRSLESELKSLHAALAASA